MIWLNRVNKVYPILRLIFYVMFAGPNASTSQCGRQQADIRKFQTVSRNYAAAPSSGQGRDGEQIDQSSEGTLPVYNIDSSCFRFSFSLHHSIHIRTSFYIL